MKLQETVSNSHYSLVVF